MHNKSHMNQLPNQEHRRRIGNHTNWQDSRQGSQLQQNRCLLKLASNAGLHSGNRSRYNTSRVLIQLMAVLSATQISSAKPATSTRKSYQSATTNNAINFSIKKSNLSSNRLNSNYAQHQLITSQSSSSPSSKTNFNGGRLKLEQEVTNIRRKREIHEIRHKEISKEFFDEQNWLIDKFLKDRDMLPNKVTSLNYLNQIIKYILEDESANRLFEVTRLLLQSFGYYGSKHGEEIADE